MEALGILLLFIGSAVICGTLWNMDVLHPAVVWAWGCGTVFLYDLIFGF